ncbi:MAG: VOC family protein [Hyphomicrobiaceae bacterium]
MSQFAPQLPSAGQIFLDHVGWFVPDMAGAEPVFAALGFPLTPFSVHLDRDPATGVSTPVGSANRLAMLARGYLEILTPVGDADTPVARHMRAALARHTGVHLIAFTVADAAADAVRLTTAGFALSPTVNLRRTIEAEDGSTVEVAFTVVRPVLGSIPEGRMQVLTHHTPDHMWQARYLPTANAITALTGAVIAVPDVVDSAARLGRLVDRVAAPGPEGMEITLDRGRLLLVTPDAAVGVTGAAPAVVPSVVAVELASHDLGQTARFLAARGLAHAASGGDRLLVPAEAAAGVAVIIRQS